MVVRFDYVIPFDFTTESELKIRIDHSLITWIIYVSLACHRLISMYRLLSTAIPSRINTGVYRIVFWRKRKIVSLFVYFQMKSLLSGHLGQKKKTNKCINFFAPLAHTTLNRVNCTDDRVDANEPPNAKCQFPLYTHTLRHHSVESMACLPSKLIYWFFGRVEKQFELSEKLEIVLKWHTNHINSHLGSRISHGRLTSLDEILNRVNEIFCVFQFRFRRFRSRTFECYNINELFIFKCQRYE